MRKPAGCLLRPAVVWSLLVCAAGSPLAGCERPVAPARPASERGPQQTPNLVFYDSGGRAVAAGMLSLSARPAEATEFDGTWRLVSAEPGFPQATVDGPVRARADGARVSINLNPGTADDNVILDGTISGDAFSGQWLHAKFAGAARKGRFSATLKR